MSVPIPALRFRQLVSNIPHYLHELGSLRRPRDFYSWAAYKQPYLFRFQEFPLRLTFEPTNECNFACPHCPRTVINSNRGIGFLELELFCKIIEEASPHRPLVKLGGLGEPALHPDLGVMMETLRERRLETILYTNGTLFERYTTSEILKWNLPLLIVSVDGTDERSFERLRVGGKYEVLRKNLATFRRAREHALVPRPEIEIRHVTMPGETAEQLAEFRRDWLHELGDTVRFNYLLPPLERHRLEDPSRPRCRDIARELYIRFDGRVPLCGYHGEWLGDLHQSTVDELWHHPRLTDVRRQHEKRDLSQLPFCRTCAFR